MDGTLKLISCMVKWRKTAAMQNLMKIYNMFHTSVFSQLSDLSQLREPVNIDPEHLGSLAAEAFERRIANVEREKVELQRRLQGKQMSRHTLQMYCKTKRIF